MTTEVNESLQLTSIASDIQTGLEAFENRKAELTDLAKQADGLNITSIEDRASIRTVSEIRKRLKNSRVEIQKEGKSMRDPLTHIGRMISAKENELVAIIEPTEKKLLSQERWVESEKQRIEAEAQRIEHDRIQARLDRLKEYGFELDYPTAKIMSDEDFERTVQAARVEFEKEQAEKAEQERLRIENEAREQAERAAESLRLEKEREEMAEMRRAQEARQKELDDQQAAIAAERRKIQEEAEAIERKRIQAEADAVRQADIEKARIEAAEQARLKAIEDARLEDERKKAEVEKARIAAEKKAARQPDKVKLLSFAERLSALVDFEMKTTEGEAVKTLIVAQLNKLKTAIEEHTVNM